MKKMILVLWVGALLAGCGEKTQTSDSEVNESPSTIKVFALPSPHVISVKQTTAGPRYYFGTKEIALRDIRASLSKFPEKKVLIVRSFLSLDTKAWIRTCGILSVFFMIKLDESREFRQ